MRDIFHDQRGATGVEVALLLALVAVVVLGAVQFLGGRSSSSLEQAHEGITRPTAAGGGGSATGGGSSGGGSTGGSSGGGSTAPPTTVRQDPTTTTTTTTTTTRPKTTTTTTPPPVATPTLDDGSTARSGSSYWTASATLDVAAPGGGLSGAEVTLRIRTRKNGSSSWTTSTVTVTTGPDGRIDLDLGPYRRTGSSRIVEVEVVVVDVAPPGDATWDGAAPTIGFSPPA